MSDLRDVPAIVKPRKPYSETRRLIVVTGDSVFLEKSGEVFPRSDVSSIMLRERSSIIVCENAALLLMELEAAFSDLESWSWRVTPVERKTYRQHRRDKPTTTIDAVVNYFGFRYESETGRFTTRYHYPIDTLTFLSGSNGTPLTDQSKLDTMISWGADVRAFCTENQLKISATSGGLAAQLLRDARFFPEARRKIPKATNAKARPQLPGNHYELFIPEGSTVMDALYLDMRSAHHYAAARVTFPHPDRMYGRGAFRTPPETHVAREPWARYGTPKFRAMIATHGLFLLRLNVPPRLQKTATEFPPPWLRQGAGIKLAYVYSNELELLDRHGVVIEGIEAAWTASTTDTGLNDYASWAMSQNLTMSDERRAWAKPTLLAAYGLLASKPKAREFGYRHALNGEPAVYMTAGGPLAVEALKTSREIESPVTNVILRGMIEAEVRKCVLDLATELTSFGVRVLALYADSVIVAADVAMPLLPDPWTVKSPMSRLTFFNPVSFTSTEMTKLPGMPREGVERLRLRSEHASVFAAVKRGILTPPSGVPWSENRLQVIEVRPKVR